MILYIVVLYILKKQTNFYTKQLPRGVLKDKIVAESQNLQQDLPKNTFGTAHSLVSLQAYSLNND